MSMRSFADFNGTPWAVTGDWVAPSPSPLRPGVPVGITTNTRRGLSSGHRWGPLLGHQWGLSHGHGHSEGPIEPEPLSPSDSSDGLIEPFLITRRQELSTARHSRETDLGTGPAP